LVKTYTDHSDAEMEAALATAHALDQSDWSQGPIERRLAVLSRLSQVILENKDEMAKIATTEMGKPLSEARTEVEFIASIARYYAEHAGTSFHRNRFRLNMAKRGWSVIRSALFSRSNRGTCPTTN
jgi:acyl-CoA reductase-like NAD-dependent aldehyde dehydrogenase